jgi:hypothetical protein
MQVRILHADGGLAGKSRNQVCQVGRRSLPGNPVTKSRIGKQSMKSAGFQGTIRETA